MGQALAPPVGGNAVRRYMPLATLIAGTTVGGLVLGVGLVVGWFVVGMFEGARTALALAIGGVVILALLWPPARAWLPEASCQVRREPMVGSLTRAGFRWGLDLGTGVRTFLVTPALYAVLVIAMAQPAAWLALGVGAFYGLARGLVMASVAVVHSHQGLGGYGPMGPPGMLEKRLRWPLAVAVAGAALLAI